MLQPASFDPKLSGRLDRVHARLDTQPLRLRRWLLNIERRHLERQIPHAQLVWSKAGAR